MAAVGVLLTGSLSAQELPLRREIPRQGKAVCEGRPPTRTPTDEERAQAEQLGSSASQAVILGDNERARDLLARAVQLNPTSTALTYQYARILEDLGESDAAQRQYCLVLALASDSPEATDAQGRLDALTARAGAMLPTTAVARFRDGVAAAEAGRLDEAAAAFAGAASLAPEWPDAAYNQGAALARLGRRREAIAALRRYLQLQPDAPDGILVSERIGQLQTGLSTPSPGAAFTLGLLIPGMGQFYSGRPVPGLAVLSLAGGAAAFALLSKETHVKCRQDPGPGADCPPEDVLGETSDRPYLAAGLGAAGAITVLGAIEALVKARGRRGSEGPMMSMDIGSATITGPTVAAQGIHLDLRLVGIRF